MQSFLRFKLIVEVLKAKSRTKLNTKIWKIHITIAVFLFCFNLSTMLLSFLVLFLLLILCSDSFKSTNTSKKLYFAY